MAFRLAPLGSLAYCGRGARACLRQPTLSTHWSCASLCFSVWLVVFPSLVELYDAHPVSGRYCEQPKSENRQNPLNGACMLFSQPSKTCVLSWARATHPFPVRLLLLTSGLHDKGPRRSCARARDRSAQQATCTADVYFAVASGGFPQVAGHRCHPGPAHQQRARHPDAQHERVVWPQRLDAQDAVAGPRVGARARVWVRQRRWRRHV